ncbi:hypothetical protein PFISCL1PPCAC_20393 [Pristionchus fissidentatus]|uniref:DNA polymerase epsilon catalytic subunit n=1 Tax=Pristionchus fissidentatus TaxID=1538716 RepID=A0AAV5WB15_9BILA|nr:hypothetical protein PFISCL1PPCAC_20393 [Pristionchus fissidentatus]
MDEELLAQAIENDANYEERLAKIKSNNEIDAKFGYENYTQPQERVSWLVNIAPAEMVDEQTKVINSAVDFYFLEESGKRFKITYPFRPYCYVAIADNFDLQAAAYISKKYPFVHVEHVEKEDLDLKNHLSGIRAKYLKLSFPSTAELMKVKKDLMVLVRKNSEKRKEDAEFATLLAKQLGGITDETLNDDVLTKFIDIREHDVPLDCRVSIDEKLFVGKWFTVCGMDKNRRPSIKDHSRGSYDPVDPIVLAFDIECTKLPLKFPDATFDEIMMISYMIDGVGYLIINRQIVASDIEDFEYTPREDIKGAFTIFNEPDELGVIKKFFSHILSVQPNVIVTYNGDFFDWPFVEARAEVRGLSMASEIGYEKNAQEEYKSRNCIHMDAFKWVKRDSYLPVGSQNLKAVAKAKLRYDPMEVDPEEMCQMARENPQALANYSVSDAVATYYLYMKYVHPFIFALCTIIPLGGDDVLRKGSGTLCEALLMVEAFHNNIVFPNKYTGKEETEWTGDGHKIESETYVGGHVEALEAGLFRADIPTRFRLVPAAIAQLSREAGITLEKELVREYGITRENVTNWEDAIGEVTKQLDVLLMHPARLEKPRIYHLDVGAMYPNIILTNRLQPSAIVEDSTCIACCYNTTEAKCKRKMKWEWRGELIPASRGEYERLLRQLEGESFGKPPKPFHTLKKEERQKLEKKRVQDYCRRVYGKQHLTRNEMRESTICQRENAFYVDTVKNFRDRRYEYKDKLKKAKSELDKVDKNDASATKRAQGMCVLFESLQLAHKCILNSFYGYVMRKGSRWFSMEMAGIVCHTGANIIMEARKLVEQIGRALELDTDGIWCLLPASFPENVTFELQNHAKKRVTISYPAAMLNAPVQDLFTNEQYHNLQSDGSYTLSNENSIYFEVDGPYQAIILPASKEEGKKLKKRYAVFNLDGSLAELKGFELKRRGELNVIKQFQSSVFKAFLRGSTLEEAYESVAREANYWLDVLFSRGVDMNDSELFDLIGENRSMSRKLEDYGEQKSTSISTAKRLAEFLGDDVVKEAGIACHFVISRFPLDAPVTERTIPLAIFQAEPSVRAHYLRKWTKISSITAENLNIRDLIDWSYYIERTGGSIQKIITIPAALQGISNPVPRIAHPDWLDNKIRKKVNAALQPKVTDHFTIMSKAEKRKQQEEAEESAKRRRDEEGEEELDGEGDKENRGVKRKKGGERVEEEDDNVKIVSMAEEGVLPWLRSLQKMWRVQRKQEKLRKMRAEAAEREGGIVERRAGGGIAGTGSLLNHMRINQTTVWQVISVEDSKQPGVWFAWLTNGRGGKCERVSVRLLRSLLVNRRDKKTEDVVRRILPRGHPIHYLYQHKVEETRLQELKGKLQREACTSTIEGIYESEVPPHLRLLSSIGCAVEAKLEGGSLNPDTARRQTVPEYLGAGQKISSVFYYKYTQESRAIVAVMCASTAEGVVIAAGGGGAMPNMATMYSSVFDEMDSLPPDVKSNMSITMKTTKTIEDADKEVEKWLRKLVSSSTRITILCCIGNKTALDGIRQPGIMPVIPLNQKEPRNLLSTIDYQRIVARRILKHFFYHFQYLEDFINWARFLHIPIGNIPADSVQFGLDVLLSRHLDRAGHASWASDSAKPDLGGKESEDVRLAYEWKPLDKDSATLICRPNMCMEYCVDMQVDALAVNAVVQRGCLMEAEGSDEVMHLEGGEGTSVDASIRILRQMLAELVREIAVNKSQRADELVIGLRRWLTTPSSFLFDPMLARYVSTLEKKLALLLSTEFTRLGASVIYASPSRFVFSTGKKTLSEAEAFMALLKSSLSSTQLFAAVHMHVSTMYSTLLFKDNKNYAGVVEKRREDYEREQDEIEEVDGEAPSSSGKVESRWRMAEELGEMGERVMEEYENVVNGYVLITHAKTVENCDPDWLLSSRQSIIRGDLLTRLLRVTERFLRLGSDGAAAAGALNRAVCDAVAVDAAVADDVMAIREQLMKVVQETKQRVHPLYVCDVVCSSCGQSMDEVDVSDPSTWSCGSCSKSVQQWEMEERVVTQLKETLTLFLVQDHRCMKCGQIRRENLCSTCDCSGCFTNTLDGESFSILLSRVEVVAVEREMTMVVEVVQWIKQVMGC